MAKKKTDKKKSKQQAAKVAAPQNKTQEQQKRTNILKIEAKLFAEKYTNERIRKQIDGDSTLFFANVGMLIFAAAIIIISFINAYRDISPNGTFSAWVHSVRNDHPLGLVFGITIFIFVGIGLEVMGTPNMGKHIFPACSGRLYRAKEIDEQANDPETVWLKEAAVYAAPKALIGVNRGLAVAEYKDIKAISLKTIHHSKNTSHTAGRGRVGPARAFYYAMTDHYNEWNTYCIVIHTRNHRRFVLSETAYKEGYKELIPFLDEHCGRDKVEYKIKD